MAFTKGLSGYDTFLKNTELEKSKKTRHANLKLLKEKILTNMTLDTESYEYLKAMHYWKALTPQH